MCKWIVLCLAAILTPGVVLAGPNDGGVLLVHDCGLLYTSDSSTYLSPVPACDDIDAELPTGIPTGGTGYVWKVLAAFPENASPRLKATAFGATFGAEVYVLAGGLIDPGADFEIAQDGWPTTSGGAVGLSFGQTKTGNVNECYWLGGYAYSGAWQLVTHSVQGGQFVDDSVPPVSDAILAFGSIGFGIPGWSPCPGVPGACCLPTGECYVVSIETCLLQAGVPRGGTCSPAPCSQSPGHGPEEQDWLSYPSTVEREQRLHSQLVISRRAAEVASATLLVPGALPVDGRILRTTPTSLLLTFDVAFSDDSDACQIGLLDAAGLVLTTIDVTVNHTPGSTPVDDSPAIVFGTTTTDALRFPSRPPGGLPIDSLRGDATLLRRLRQLGITSLSSLIRDRAGDPPTPQPDYDDASFRNIARMARAPVPPGLSCESLCRIISRLPAIAFAFPDVAADMYSSYAGCDGHGSNEGLYEQQWYLRHEHDQDLLYGIAADYGWCISRGLGATIALISGSFGDHSDLSGRNIGEPMSMSCAAPGQDSHALAVLSVAAAAHDNRLLAGIAPDACWVHLPSSFPPSTSEVLSACVDMRSYSTATPLIHVFPYGWSADEVSETLANVLEQEFTTLHDVYNVVHIAARGYRPEVLPAMWDQSRDGIVVSVGGSTKSGTKGLSLIADVYAPGEDLTVSMCVSGASQYFTWTANYEGSIPAGLVAGAAAVYVGASQSTTVEAVEEAILGSVYGPCGIVNVGQMVGCTGIYDISNVAAVGLQGSCGISWEVLVPDEIDGFRILDSAGYWGPFQPRVD